MRRFPYLIVLLTLAGCASSPPAPVTSARKPVVVEKEAVVATAPATRDEFYTVKQGDNLYRIALNNGVSTRDLMEWNNLSDETKISIGQELRIKPPAGAGVEVKPVVGSTAITVVGESGAGGGSASGADGAIREPKGGKIAYSNTALAQARAMDGSTPPTARPTEPVVTVTPPPSVPAVSAGFDWTWPGAGKVIQGFGKNESGEISRGIDLAGRKGEPIQAIGAGKVSFVGSLDKYGDFIIVRHDADYLSVYAHTSKILVKLDQVVTKGEKIAEIGSSGTDQAKLHFEIRHKGQPVDPLKLLPQRQ
ncbi:MAG: peptidoglycan DD-metalloendopeptidase family protein [Zoogloeaceae bacterium]|jgi:lipoprotein NlpD|nr:peptidoglycan DD-metalloendopeptidase family protein [Zoogloeaceae bacterium]